MKRPGGSATPRARVCGKLALSVTVSVFVWLGGSAPASDAAVFEGPPATATCGAGSMPEQGIQGEVPLADRHSGRSNLGYTCNLQVVGRFGSDMGAEWQMATYDHCAYYARRSAILGGSALPQGTVVLDVSDPANPKQTATLTSPAMLGPWESLSVNEERGLLGAVFAPVQGAGPFDVYDVKTDCAHPKLLSSTLTSLGSHEGKWAPDGKTYYASGLGTSMVTAIDTTDPTAPKILTAFSAASVIHGLGMSPDGNRMYLALINADFLTGLIPGSKNLAGGNGMAVYDTSSIQNREKNPTGKLVGAVTWKDGSTGQHATAFTKAGRPYALFVDELGRGGPRIIDLQNEKNPRVISKLRLAIQMNEKLAREEETNTLAPDGRRMALPRGVLPFGYNAHLCALDKQTDPTIAVCSEFNSGMRVFDIRDLTAPKEIAYFNPGGNGTLNNGSWGGTTAGFTSALPHIDAQRGMIWFTDQDKGFYTAKFTNGVWPFKNRNPTPCASRRTVTFTLPKGATNAKVTVNGRRRGITRKGRKLTLKLVGSPRSKARVTITAKVGKRAYRRITTLKTCSN